MKHSFLSTGIAVFFITILCFSCKSYKIITTESKGVFIQSPAVKLKFKNNSSVRDRYYYIVFYGITDRYLETSDRLDECDTWSGDIDYFESKNNDNLERKLHSGRTGYLFYSFNSALATTPYKIATLNDKKTILFIQFDYASLLSPVSEIAISDNFRDLAINLLIEISGKEGPSPGYNWASTISQNIVEKIWERIPIPQTASLSRFACKRDGDFSLMPLNPKIHLRVDHSTTFDSRQNLDLTTVYNYLRRLKDYVDSIDVSPNKDGKDFNISIKRSELEGVLSSDGWRYEFSGQTFVNFTKVQRSSDGAVLFKFDPFMSTEFPRSSNLPTNTYKSIEGVKLLTSSIDPEFTSGISMSKFIFLYHKNLKGNNSTSTIGSVPIDRCCRQELGLVCNSLLFYSNDVSLLATPLSNCATLKPFAIFGERSPIVPCISVYVNSNLTNQPLGYIMYDLAQNADISRDVSVKRIYNGKLIEIKNVNIDLLLLPGDVLKSK